MWLFTKDGFFSIVHKDCGADEVLVRARVRVDLKRLIDSMGVEVKILKNVGSDYQFRIVVKKSDFASYVTQYVNSLDYDNFKNTLQRGDSLRHSAYTGVWVSMMRMQSDR